MKWQRSLPDFPKFRLLQFIVWQEGTRSGYSGTTPFAGNKTSSNRERTTLQAVASALNGERRSRILAALDRIAYTESGLGDCSVIAITAGTSIIPIGEAPVGGF
jgi:hypothetical protein